MTDKATISFICKNCGTKLSWDEDTSDDAHVLCKGCGQDAGTYGDMKKAALERTKAELRAMVEKAFKRR